VRSRRHRRHRCHGFCQRHFVAQGLAC
jgi:hypothetical protein